MAPNMPKAATVSRVEVDAPDNALLSRRLKKNRPRQEWSEKTEVIRTLQYTTIDRAQDVIRTDWEPIARQQHWTFALFTAV